MWVTSRIFRKIHSGIANLNEVIDLNKLTNSEWKNFKCIYSLYTIELVTTNGFVNFNIEKTNSSFKIIIKEGSCNKATFKYTCMEDY